VIRLRGNIGLSYYVKIQRHKAFWHQEVYAYRNWARVFGPHAPTLLAIHETEPLAILTTALAGRSMDQQLLSMAQEIRVWDDAGRYLARLHGLAVGGFFGPCRSDGSSLSAPRTDAVDYMAAEIEASAKAAAKVSRLDDAANAAIRAARERLPAFAGERPIPCHRDYGPANWLIGADGRWAGVVDFEMAQWDVRVADFARYPNWEWIRRPDLVEALLRGYGRALNDAERQQLFCVKVAYALTAIAWGIESKHELFAQEGRQALRHIATVI
jgi:Ser/Thr protein kinase RdoA (MazF antagonist)